MATYKINSIDREKGHVSVTYDVDGLEQVMGDAPLDDAAALQQFLSDYGTRYAASLASVIASSVIASDVDALVGLTLDVMVPPIDSSVPAA